MDAKKFSELQYKTLREEIKEGKARGVKVLLLGISLLPGAELLAKHLEEFRITLLALPLVVIIFALIFLSENNTVMRSGFFIRKYIEPEFAEGSAAPVKGWETWLEEPTDQEFIRKRKVDRYLARAFLVIFLFYYSGAVAIALNSSELLGAAVWFWVATTSYIVGGLLFFLFAMFNLATSTGQNRWTFRVDTPI